jgi:adenylosuccinate lyase
MPSQIPAAELDKAYASIMGLSGYLPPNAARYLSKEVIGYVSPDALHSYMLGILRNYADVLGELGEIGSDVAAEIGSKVTRENVPFKRAEYWEGVIHHDIRGLVRAAQEVLGDKAKSFVYPGFTSYDLINTAQSLALRDFAYELMIPESVKFGKGLIKRARDNKETVMVGRTHLQHAATTTAGHWFVEILGGIVPPLVRYNSSTGNLRGKASGFVGNNAARCMLFGTDPDEIDRMFFEKIGLKPDDPTGQTVHQHWYTDYFSQLVQICGGIANFANDLRKYQQTEVGEMAEQMLSQQVGSSTGAHKQNPIRSERTSGGSWRQLFGQYMASLFDLQTDFQRDLRDSSNKRGYMYNMPNIAHTMAKTGARIADKMTVRKGRMAENLGMTRGLICAEPLQSYLQRWCGLHCSEFFDAHEHVRKLTNKAIEEGTNFIDLVQQDELIMRALEDTRSEDQREMILSPEKYLGTSSRQVERYTQECEETLDSLLVTA